MPGVPYSCNAHNRVILKVDLERALAATVSFPFEKTAEWDILHERIKHLEDDLFGVKALFESAPIEHRPTHRQVQKRGTRCCCTQQGKRPLFVVLRV